jgi:3D (Asp-Asp-Asp) domain-containing protein
MATTVTPMKHKRLASRLILAVLMALVAIFVMAALTTPVKSGEPSEGVAEVDEPEDYENQKIETAMLEKANVIEDCTVTWYTADTCGKKPGDPAYGITRSGMPVVEHLTCAVDTDVIPLYSDVFVQYADGTIEQLWATDTGVTGNSVDIYTPDYDYAIQCGRQRLTVWGVWP